MGKEIESCVKCEHCSRNYCEKVHIYLDGYHWICKEYSPNEPNAVPSQINASYAYLERLIELNNTCNHYKALIEQLSADIPGQQLSEKITGSPAGQKDEKVIALIDAKEIYKLKQQDWEAEWKCFCDKTIKMEHELHVVLVDYYINGKTAKQMADSLDITTRTFFRRCNEALHALYPHLDEEYKRLAR